MTYTDFYGGKAVLTTTRDGHYRVKVYNDNGKLYHNKTYATERGARIGMGMLTDGGWKLVPE